MKLKEPPTPASLPISTFLLHRDRYKIDRTYQRESGTWKKSDEQYFIDTILRGFGVPPIFLHKKGDSQFIVDGQQRLHTIWKFKDEKLVLGHKYSAAIINDRKNKEKNGGKPALRYGELDRVWQDRIDSYPLPIIYLEHYDDEEIRDLFRRLQHGKPLIPGEILNAFPGDIVIAMRKIARSSFFKNIVPVKANRYKHYHIAAQLMFLESEGIKDISPNYIYDFFSKNKGITQDSKIYSKVNKTLNYIASSFLTKTPEIKRPGWIITLYLFTSYLLDSYAMDNHKKDLKKFFLKFYSKVSSSSNSSDKELIDFNFAISKGTTSQSNIKLRHNIILKRFFAKYNPVKLDENRLFSTDQKIAIFRRDKEKCKICGKKLRFNDPETHFHHKDKYIEGGKTEIDKGMLVCRECHLNKIHGSNRSS